MSKWVKGAHQSSSRIGQYQHDWMHRTFTAIDIDNVVYKRAKKLLRVFEEKLSGETLGKSQAEVLGILAQLIVLGAEEGHLNAHSGVYVLTWLDDEKTEPATPAHRVTIKQVNPDGSTKGVIENAPLADVSGWIAGDVDDLWAEVPF